MDLSVANKQGGSVSEVKDFRKGNWTVQETMVLIEAKKMDDERRMKRPGHGGERGKPAELRWKWVEDYCCKRGCFRSQNQCNDKWDNLMRDFKRVREYEGIAAAAGGGGDKSYWRIEKNERKEKNLPSNMLPEIYEALMGATEKKSPRFSTALVQPSMPHPPPLTQVDPPTHPPPPPPPPPPPEKPTLAFSHILPTVGRSDCERSDESESAAKRRKGEGRIRLEEVGNAISQSATMIAEAIQSCDEREGRRERERMSVHERRLQIEESKAEIHRRGINSLVDAINKLADSIFALAHQTNQRNSPK